MASTNSYSALSALAWPVRFLRTLAASLLSLAIAVGGHRFGGGEIARGILIGAVFAIVFAVAWLLSVRQLTAGQVVGLLLIAQVLVHMSCAFGNSVAVPGRAMVIGHILATAVATWVLVRGERFFWAMADRLGLHALSLIFAPLGVVGPAPRLRSSRQEIHLPPRIVLVGGNGLRGPPVGCA